MADIDITASVYGRMLSDSGAAEVEVLVLGLGHIGLPGRGHVTVTRMAGINTTRLCIHINATGLSTRPLCVNGLIKLAGWVVRRPQVQMYRTAAEMVSAIIYGSDSGGGGGGWWW